MREYYILIKTIGEVEIVKIEKEQFLEKCYELISCELIEVCIPDPSLFSSDIRFIVDELGKLNGQHFNMLASVLYNCYDFLFGNVIIGKFGYDECGELDIFGFTYSEALSLSLRINSYVR